MGAHRVEMHVLRIAIPANLTHEEGGFSLALEGLRIAIPANLPYEEGGFSLALQFDPWPSGSIRVSGRSLWGRRISRCHVSSRSRFWLHGVWVVSA